MGCLVGLLIVLVVLCFKFLFLACGITCIVVGSVYIFNYVQATIEGLVVPNGMMMLFGSAGLIALGILLIRVSFKKSEKKENNHADANNQV